MNLNRPSRRELLADKSGIATSMPEAIGGLSIKMVGAIAGGAVLATLLGFYAVTTASADTSSGFQSANVLFEKSVRASDVVVGNDSGRVGLLTDMPGDKCQVETWQKGTREGATTLQVDTKTVAGVCTPTTPLLTAGSGQMSQELLVDIEAPVFTYSNLGGRTITFNAAGAPTLASGAKPEGVKVGDWDDVRPYKAILSVATVNDDAAKTTKKSVSTGYTNVVNVTAAADSLRYVPAPDESPIPGPITITSVERSKTTGTLLGGVREGIAVTFAGAVCPAGPTKVNVSYTQQDPTVAPAVNTVLNGVLTGTTSTVDLGQVPNGSSGAVEVAATCVDGGVVEKGALGYTQTVPATVLTAKQHATLDRHELSWTKVSSLPTQFELSATVGEATEKAITTTDKLAFNVDYEKGSNLGLTTTYKVVAVVDSNRSPDATASITNPLPKPAPTVVTANAGGATWAAIVCTTGATAQYSERHYTQTGTSTAISWSKPSAWSIDRSMTNVTTPGGGRTVFEVESRCVAEKSGVISPTSTSNQDAFYMPSDLQISSARSTTTGVAYAGAREASRVVLTGASCYGSTPTVFNVTWTPQAPAGQKVVAMSTTKAVAPNAQTILEVDDVKNGAFGEFETWADCEGVKSGGASDLTEYTQPLPAATVAVKQGANANQHIVSWNQVSSLSTSFQVWKKAAVGQENTSPAKTTALTQTFNYVAGTNYGNKTDYAVGATVSDIATSSNVATITTPWPATPRATGINYTRTGENNHYPYGRVKWGFDSSCAPNTTLRAGSVENRTGQSNGTFDTSVKSRSTMVVDSRETPWGPGGALDGYAYGVAIETICTSNVTGIESPRASAQSGEWVIPMRQPGMSSWDAYNLREMRRGTDWTYSTCQPGGCTSMVVDWTTHCYPGSSLNWSTYTATSWTGSKFYHAYGWHDNWKLPDNASMLTVYYSGAQYNCRTPWAESPASPATGTTNIQVRR
jgi:hypothetical protein